MIGAKGRIKALEKKLNSRLLLPLIVERVKSGLYKDHNISEPKFLESLKRVKSGLYKDHNGNFYTEEEIKQEEEKKRVIVYDFGVGE